MEKFCDWARKRFVLAEFMDMADVDNESLKAMLFENGPTRDLFIKHIVYKMLLQISDDGSKEHDLERIFVQFGILDTKDAQTFLKGNLSTNLHVALWKKIIKVLIPKTTFALQETSHDEMMNHYYEMYKHFKANEKKNYLPPELMPKKLPVHHEQKTINSENDEEIVDKVVNILKKIKGNGEFIPNSEEEPLNHMDTEFKDLLLMKNEVDHLIKKTNKKEIAISINKPSIELTSQQLADLANEPNLIQSHYIEKRINNISELMNAEYDLQTLASSIANA